METKSEGNDIYSSFIQHLRKKDIPVADEVFVAPPIVNLWKSVLSQSYDDWLRATLPAKDRY